jgi:hypothetical protein
MYTGISSLALEKKERRKGKGKGGGKGGKEGRKETVEYI